MPMKLYHFPPAPNPAKVLAYIREKGLDDIELVLVDFFNQEQTSPAHLARSPRGTVPVLELDDGTCLTESLPIIEYLEEQFPNPWMIGRTPLERAQVRSRERYIEMNILSRVIRLVHATRSPLGLPPNPGVAASEQARLPEALSHVNAMVGTGPFVCGAQPTIADCTLLAALNFARFGQIELAAEYAHLQEWFDQFALRHLQT